MLTERSARVAAAHRLLRRIRRAETGEFLAEGAQSVREALGHARDVPGSVRELFLTEEAANRHVDLVRAAYAAGVEVSVVSPRAAELLSDTQAPQGLVARCATVEVPLEQALGSAPRLVVVLLDANDPGNAGTVVRLADATGADAVIFAGHSVDPTNPKVVRASAGSLFHLPVAKAADAVELLVQLGEAGLQVVATSGTAEVGLDVLAASGRLALPTAWLFGSEAHGLPAEIIANADHQVRVPIYGRAESLNLATAAAVCLYASAGAHHPPGG